MIVDKAVKVIGQMDESFETQGRVYDKDGLCPAIRTFQGGGLQPKIIVEKSERRDCKVIGGLGEKKSNGGTQYFQQDKVYYGDIAMCQPANLPGGSYNYAVKEKKTAIPAEGWRIRKLTPRECWRLMGFADTDFDKASAVCSNSQLYKQAGNSIVRQVLMAIFSQMNIKGVRPWNENLTEEEK